MTSNDAPVHTVPAELEFTVSGFIARPPGEVFEALADPEILSRYFTTGGARGRLVAGTTVSWEFADFPGAFPVQVIEATSPDAGGNAGIIVVSWDGDPMTTVHEGSTRVEFVLLPVDAGARTEVRVSEGSWRTTTDGARAAFGNCMGWTGMLAAMKAWLEHGINLREGFYK